MRTLRFADGPDEVHQRLVAMMEIKSQLKKVGLDFKPGQGAAPKKVFARL